MTAGDTRKKHGQKNDYSMKMALRFNPTSITLLLAVLLYVGALGFQIHSYHKPIQLRGVWEDVSVNTYEPNDPLSWLIYVCWLFLASFTLAFRARAQSLVGFSWWKFSIAGLLLLISAFAAFASIQIAFDSEVG